MPGPVRFNKKGKVVAGRDKGGGRVIRTRGRGKPTTVTPIRSGGSSGGSSGSSRRSSGGRTRAERSLQRNLRINRKRAKVNPLATKPAREAIDRLREKYSVSMAANRRERALENTAVRSAGLEQARKFTEQSNKARTGGAAKAERAVQTIREGTNLNTDGRTAKTFRGLKVVGTIPAEDVRQAAERGQLRRAKRRQVTTPEVRRVQKKVKRVAKRIKRLERKAGKGGVPEGVPPEYAKWIRKFSPRLDKQARATYGLSGAEFMAKMLQGESGFDMNKVGPNTPYGNARGAAQFIPGTRQDFIDKFGIDPWRSVKEAVQAMALHLDGKSYSKTFGIQGYNPGINDSYYLNQEVGPVRRGNPRARQRLNRVRERAGAINQEAAKLGIKGAEGGKSEDRYKGPLPDGNFSWPLSVRGKMGGGPEDHAARAFGNWMSDNAVDIIVPVGTPVRAISDAVVTRISGSKPNHAANPAGWTVYLKDKDGEEYAYMHLEDYSVKAGDRIRGGQEIGKSGAANSVPHLHLATKKNDPRAVLSNAGKAGKGKPKFVNYSKKGGRGTSSTKWLAPTGGNEVLRFQRPLAEALVRLAKASGQPIRVNSAFRSNKEQADLYQQYLNGTGNLAAPPGQSNHNHGAAADVELTAKQRELAPKFGLGFPVAGEDWHIELVGNAASGIVSGMGGGSYGGVSSTGGSSAATTSTGTTTGGGSRKRKGRRETALDRLAELGFRVTPEGIKRTGVAGGPAPSSKSSGSQGETLTALKRKYKV